MVREITSEHYSIGSSGLVIDVRNGETIADGWPSSPPLAGRAFDWIDGEVGPWRAMTEEERQRRQAAWERYRRRR
jgi:hypothetical protein